MRGNPSSSCLGRHMPTQYTCYSQALKRQFIIPLLRASKFLSSYNLSYSPPQIQSSYLQYSYKKSTFVLQALRHIERRLLLSTSRGDLKMLILGTLKIIVMSGTLKHIKRQFGILFLSTLRGNLSSCHPKAHSKAIHHVTLRDQHRHKNDMPQRVLFSAYLPLGRPVPGGRATTEAAHLFHQHHYVPPTRYVYTPIQYP
jgi:hypothetical protein